MAAELKSAFPEVTVTMVPAAGGVFEVTVDDDLIFSKKALRRHAEPGEIVRLIHERAT